MTIDLIHFAGRDDRLVRVQKALALLGDRLLEIGEDFLAIRVVAQLALRGLQIGDERVVSALVDLVRVAVQVD